MSDIEKGGAAFPVVTEATRNEDSSTGMTLRDYFAAKAMQGMYAGYKGNPPAPDEIAHDAYAIADEMIKERAK